MLNRSQIRMTPRKRIDKARKTNNLRDGWERDVGLATPGACTPDLTLRTIMCAIQCGLEMEDWNCVAEAYEMAIDLHMTMKGVRYDPVRSSAARADKKRRSGAMT